jgi:hypothetical protein
MALDISTPRDVLTSHAQARGGFGQVLKHEPLSAPGSGLTYAVWVGDIDPLPAASGLASTSVRVVFNGRLYLPADTAHGQRRRPAADAATDLMASTPATSRWAAASATSTSSARTGQRCAPASATSTSGRRHGSTIGAGRLLQLGDGGLDVSRPRAAFYFSSYNLWRHRQRRHAAAASSAQDITPSACPRSGVGLLRQTHLLCRSSTTPPAKRPRLSALPTADRHLMWDTTAPSARGGLP